VFDFLDVFRTVGDECIDSVFQTLRQGSLQPEDLERCLAVGKELHGGEISMDRFRYVLVECIVYSIIAVKLDLK